MPTSAAGSKATASSHPHRTAGFTLLELLVVLMIIAIATAAVSLSLRDNADTALEREAERLAALLEGGRARSRTSGVPVYWRPLAQGFRFEGLPEGSLPSQWQATGIQVEGAAALLILGPEPILPRQQIALRLADRRLFVGTDGVRPFAVSAEAQP